MITIRSLVIFIIVKNPNICNKKKKTLLLCNSFYFINYIFISNTSQFFKFIIFKFFTFHIPKHSWISSMHNKSSFIFTVTIWFLILNVKMTFYKISRYQIVSKFVLKCEVLHKFLFFLWCFIMFFSNVICMFLFNT